MRACKNIWMLPRNSWRVKHYSDTHTPYSHIHAQYFRAPQKTSAVSVCGFDPSKRIAAEVTYFLGRPTLRRMHITSRQYLTLYCS